MRILLTNDDGIHAPGLEVLEAIARELSDDLWVVAPETDQSGVSHALSLNDPLRLREIDPRRFAVRGTPTDCAIMAVRHIMRASPPDLLLSGVNRGQNAAEDVTYSGTIAAAFEGSILGVRAVALSQAYGAGGRDAVPWDCARTHGAAVLRRVLDHGFPFATVVNVNFPACAPGEVTGTLATRQGRREGALLNVEERRDGRGNAYFWLGFERARHEVAEGTDLWALRHKAISVTPLSLDMTDDPGVTALALSLGG